MPKSKQPRPHPRSEIDPNSRATVSGPAEPKPLAHADDDLTAKMAGTQDLAAQLPFNANKAAEYDPEAAVGPEPGVCAQSATIRLSAPAPCSEMNGSDKVGSGGPIIGQNQTIGPLDRVRVDSSRSRADDQPGRAGRRQPELAQGGPARADAARRLHPAREDHPLRSRAHPRAHRARARLGGARLLRVLRRRSTEFTRASLFAEAGKQTPVFVRFSTVLGERGSTDTARDVRGFAVKFYTDEGNWDLVGNNIPVFFIQDAMKFPDLVHAAKPEPHFAMPQAATAHDTFWDFVSLMPEITHMLMWAMSDRAIPRSYRMMQGFGVHTFRLVNAAGESHFVKFHWKPMAGTHSLVWDEAVKISGADPDFHRRDLWEAIEAGAYPEWELGLQIFTEEQAEGFTFDVLDATKLVPEELVPVVPVGRMVLNRNPDNFFAETEQVAFCTAHVVPGIDFTNDPLLAGPHPLLRRHADLAARRTELSRDPDQRAGRAGRTTISATACTARRIHRGRVVLRAQLARRRLPVPGRRGGFVSFPAADGGRGTRCAASRSIRRPLHAGDAVLEQPDADVEKHAHHQRLSLRAVAGADAGGPRAHGVRTAERRSRNWPSQWLRVLAFATCPRRCRRCMTTDVTPEVTVSPALSLFARPGDGSDSDAARRDSRRRRRAKAARSTRWPNG